MKALIVDDSVAMRKLLTEILKSAGFSEIDGVPDGEEALISLASGDFDLILLDWNMPIMDGYEALLRIRESYPNVPIIMVTTEAEKDRVIDALKAGADNYVIKPFRTETIQTKILETLARARR